MPFLVDHLDYVLAEGVNACAVTVMELAILIFWCVNFVAAAILISMNPACRIFFHEHYWINVLASRWQNRRCRVASCSGQCGACQSLSLFHDLEVDDRQTGIVLLLKSDERFQIVSVILP